MTSHRRRKAASAAYVEPASVDFQIATTVLHAFRSDDAEHAAGIVAAFAAPAARIAAVVRADMDDLDTLSHS